MPAPAKQLEWVEVPYLWNTYLGIPRDCYEVSSHLARTVDGYVKVNPKSHDGENRMHRWVYFNAHPDADRSLCVCHLCDNPACVRLKHLYLGTNQDNVNDKMRKGRHVSGTEAQQEVSRRTIKIAHDAALVRETWRIAVEAAAEKNRALTDSQVMSLRALSKAGVKGVDLASYYGISRAAISNIIHRKSYAWVK